MRVSTEPIICASFSEHEPLWPSLPLALVLKTLGWGTHLHQREQEAFEECGRLVQRLFEAVVKVHIELLVLMDVIAHAVQQDQRQESASPSVFSSQTPHRFPFDHEGEGGTRFWAWADFCEEKSLVAS